LRVEIALIFRAKTKSPAIQTISKHAELPYHIQVSNDILATYGKSKIECNSCLSIIQCISNLKQYKLDVLSSMTGKILVTNDNAKDILNNSAKQLPICAFFYCRPSLAGSNNKSQEFRYVYFLLTA